MVKVWTLARTTLREMLREKVFFVVVIIAVALLGLSILLGAMSFAEQQRILADFGFLAIQIALMGVALFTGAFLLAKEVEKQTCLLILSRPVSREQFLLGKIGGVLLLNFLLVLSLGLLMAILLNVWTSPQVVISFVEICFSLWLESTVVLCIVICLSLIVRPVLALSMGFVVFLLGHWLADLTYFAEKSKEVLFIEIVKILHWVTPNFFKVNWKSYYFLQKGIPLEQVGWMTVHLCGWVFLLILVSNFLFRRKDIV